VPQAVSAVLPVVAVNATGVVNQVTLPELVLNPVDNKVVSEVATVNKVVSPRRTVTPVVVPVTSPVNAQAVVPVEPVASVVALVVNKVDSAVLPESATTVDKRATSAESAHRSKAELVTNVDKLVTSLPTAPVQLSPPLPNRI